MRSLRTVLIMLALCAAANASGAPTLISKNAYFELYRDDGGPSSTYQANSYSVLRVKLDLGDSAMNEQDRQGLLRRFLSQFVSSSTGAAFIITVNDQPPNSPLYVIEGRQF